MSATIQPTGSSTPDDSTNPEQVQSPEPMIPAEQGVEYRSKKEADKISSIALMIVAIIGSILMLAPLYMMLTLSLKSDAEVQSNPFGLPHHFDWYNYILTWHVPGTDNSFTYFFRNTLLIAVLTTIGTTLSSSFVAFGFARLRFPGRDRLFILLLSTMMLPTIVTLMPSYIGFRYLHWIDTLYPLIVPSFFAAAFNVFLLRQFFMTIPRDLDEAARLDGASYFTIYWKIILPLTKPALITVGLFAFIYAWKDLMAPLIYLNSPENQTLELGLRTFLTIHQTNWNLLMAGSVMVLIPLLVLFFIGQKYFVRGIVMQGLKD
jgi:multiple sugar transport system permease protein